MKTYRGAMFHEGDRARVSPYSQWYKDGIRTVRCVRDVTKRGVCFVECELTGQRFRLHSSLLQAH